MRRKLTSAIVLSAVAFVGLSAQGRTEIVEQVAADQRRDADRVAARAFHVLVVLGDLAVEHPARTQVPAQHPGGGIADLPRGARVGTSSLRRRAQLLAARPDLSIVELRGNVDTRLRKQREGACEAVVVAAAGLLRLGIGTGVGTCLGPDQFVPAVGQGALAVLVGEDGAVENRIVDLPVNVPVGALEEASNYISARLYGRTLDEASRIMRAEIDSGQSALDAASRDLVERGLAVWSRDAMERPVLIVRGQANLLDEAALYDLERVRSLLDDLENKQSVAELLDVAREAEATRIFIGSENRLFALSGSSVIASPYRDREGRVVGVVGVIGPTRLNYARVVPMVDFTAQSLGKLIG